jgi:hypothetical protein
MWFKHRAWIPVARLLAFGNLVSVWFAAAPGQPLHATLHALAAVLFALGAQRLAARRRPANDVTHADQLQQSLDAIALEVERISEGQRYVTRLMDEKLRSAIDSREADPVAVKRRDTPGDLRR